MDRDIIIIPATRIDTNNIDIKLNLDQYYLIQKFLDDTYNKRIVELQRQGPTKTTRKKKPVYLLPPVSQLPPP